jgi:hypothetical protein
VVVDVDVEFVEVVVVAKEVVSGKAVTVVLTGFLCCTAVDDKDFTPVNMDESTFTVPAILVDEFLFGSGKQRLIPQHLIMYPLFLMPVVES